MSADIPDYANYTLRDLYQVLNSIRKDLVPHVYEALVTEIKSREPASSVEVEDCYHALDKQKNPEFAAMLVDQFHALDDTPEPQRELITEENKYKTFWRRFWAQLLDGLIIAIPILIAVVVLERSGVLASGSSPYIDQFAYFVSLCYSIVLHALFGQTLGKMATGVKLFDKSEASEITWKQAAVRDVVPILFFLLSLVYLIAFGTSVDRAIESGASDLLLNAYVYSAAAWGLAEIITMLFNPKRRAVHDFIAGTVVVRV